MLIGVGYKHRSEMSGEMMPAFLSIVSPISLIWKGLPLVSMATKVSSWKPTSRGFY